MCHQEDLRKSERTGNEWNTQQLVYADDITIVGKNINIVKRNTKALFKASREDGLEVNTEKISNMVTSCHQITGQNFIY